MSATLPSDLASAVAAAEMRLGAFARIEHLADVASTNDLALARAAAGAPHGTVIIADAQRAGRGRQGRAWHSPPEAGIYLSAILRSDMWPESLSLVTMAAGVAAALGIRAATGLDVELKWPNDVVIGRPWRKLAGILSESASTAGRLDAVVVGIGINVRADAVPQHLDGRTTSIEIELGRAVDRAACTVEVLASLAEAADRLARGDRAWVVDLWRRFGRAGLGGATVRWDDERGRHRGATTDIDDGGALLVETSAGRIERIISGEVIWERLDRD